MGDIPSDFDPSLLFSDYRLPTPEDFEDAQEQESLDNHSDELEALHLVVEEYKERLDKEGVVIRHSIKGGRPVFRSSSLPLETPTKTCRRPLPPKLVQRSSLLFTDTYIPSSPTAPAAAPESPPEGMTFDSSALLYPRSSPPPVEPPAAKRQKTSGGANDDFEYPDSDEEDALGETAMDDDELDEAARLLPKKVPEKAPVAEHPKKGVPEFNLPGGGLFSRKFEPSAIGPVYAAKIATPVTPTTHAPPLKKAFRSSPTPPPVLQFEDKDPFETGKTMPTFPPPTSSAKLLAVGNISSGSVPVSDSVSVPGSWSGFKSTSAAGALHTYIPVVTSSGKRFEIKQRPRKVQSKFGEYYFTSLIGDNTADYADSTKKPTYYGVDIHSLLDEYNAEKSAAKRRKAKAEAQGAEEAQAAELQAAELQASESQCKVDVIAGSKQQKPLLWTEKYRAKRFTDLIGDERTHRQVLRWLKCWDPIVFPSVGRPMKKKKDEPEDQRERRKILLIHGPPGLGKTTLAHVAAKQAGYEVVEVNASDERSAAVVKGRIKDILSNEGVKSMGLTSDKKVIAGKPVCLVVDEIDGVTGGSGGGGDGGFVKALVELVLADQKNQFTTGVTKKRRRNGDDFKLMRPIVAICNDLYAPALKALRPLAEIVHMRKPPMGLMVGRLKWVFEKEGFMVEESAIRRLVEMSSMGGGADGGAAGGDMRGALVGGEWIATRLRNLPLTSAAAPKKRQKHTLTCAMVEEEFGGGGGLGESDGKGSGGGRGGIREVVEKVFAVEKDVDRRGKKQSVAKKRKTSAEKIRDAVEGLGEFDKITMDCFSTYPTRPFHDDAFLTKPCAAYEWLWFADLLSSRMFTEQYFELAGYLSHPIVAFHTLFASAAHKDASMGRYNAGGSAEDGTEKEPMPFVGPVAEWECKEGMKENRALIQSLHSCLGTVRLQQCFKSEATVAMELAPWICKILSPKISPVVVGGSGLAGGVASVRRQGEKMLVKRGVDVMLGCGLAFEKVRVEGTIGGGNAGWAFKMEPPIDTLNRFPTLSASPDNLPALPVRYAIRQCLDQEYQKELILRRQATRQARIGDPNATFSTPAAKDTKSGSSPPPASRKSAAKRDFFGRVIDTRDKPGEEETVRKKRKVEAEGHGEKVWVSFHEGYSNAVRKGITLEELMTGLI